MLSNQNVGIFIKDFNSEIENNQSRPCAKATANHTQAGLATLEHAQKRLLAKFVNQMVASAFELTGERLLRRHRGNANAARARQISMYLMHTCLSLNLTEIACIYGKDRTTIGHACRVIEDLRDHPGFDERMTELEQTVLTVLDLTNQCRLPGVAR